jgi:hypothetical protein
LPSNFKGRHSGGQGATRVGQIGWEVTERFDPNSVARGSQYLAECDAIARHLPPKPQHNAMTADTLNCLKLINSSLWLSKQWAPSIEMASTAYQSWVTAPRLLLKTSGKTWFLFQRLSVAVRRFNAVCYTNSIGHRQGDFSNLPKHTYNVELFICVCINVSRRWQ